MKTAWFKVCKSAAASANAAHWSAPWARSTREAPNPSTMMPMFSIELKRQKPLQVVLKQRIRDSPHSRERSHGKHHHAKPRRDHAHPVDQHSNQRIDGDFDHHAAHQRRYRRRRDRMGSRKPHMQRHHARFRTHANQRGDTDHEL